MATKGTTEIAERRRRFRQPPVRSYQVWDNLGDVNAALMQLEGGDFSMAARMSDGFGRDDRFAGVMATRMLAMKSVPLDIKAADEENAQAVEIAEQLGAKEKGPTEWDRMYSPANTGELARWGAMMGVGVGEQLWNTGDGDLWRPRLKVWHPQFLRWDESKQRYILRSLDGDIILPDVEEDVHSDGHWIIWCPYGYQQAWMKGLVRPLARLLLGRGWNGVDWGGYNEVYGRPFKQVITPLTKNDAVDGELFDAVAQSRGDTTIQTPQGTAPGDQKYDVKLIEATSRGWDTFDKKKGHDDRDIAILVLGQELTTAVGDSGSRALGEVQQKVQATILKADCDVSQALYDQGLYHYARINYGNPELAPIPLYRLDPPEDSLKKAQTKQATATTIQILKDAKAPIDERAAMEEVEIATLSEEEQAAREAQAAEEAAARAEQFAPGGGDQADDEPVDQTPPKGKGGKGQPVKLSSILALAAKKQDPNVVNRYHFAGFQVAVENPKNTVRKWAGGETRMQHDYGYIEGHIGTDAEGLDCYVGPSPQAKNVYVVHQLVAPTYDRHDEDKVMLGFDSHEAAVKAYVAHRNDGEKAIRGVSTIPIDRFHRALGKRTGIGPIRASAQVGTVRALMRLVERSATAVTALKAAPADDKKLRYADALVKNGTRLAARALAVDLAAVKEEIGKATSFEDLEKRVLARFRDMDPARLAGIMGKVRIMAKLGGHASVVRETGIKAKPKGKRR